MFLRFLRSARGKGRHMGHSRRHTTVAHHYKKGALGLRLLRLHGIHGICSLEDVEDFSSNATNFRADDVKGCWRARKQLCR